MTMRKERKEERGVLVGYPRRDTFSLCRLWHEKSPFHPYSSFLSSNFNFCFLHICATETCRTTVRCAPLCLLVAFVCILCFVCICLLEKSAKEYKYRELRRIESFQKERKQVLINNNNNNNTLLHLHILLLLLLP